MRNNLAPYLSFFLVCAGMQAQRFEPDSLKRVIASSRHDSVKINLYNKLAYGYRESYPDSVVFYADKALADARRIQYQPGIAEAFVNHGNGAIIFGDYKKAISEFAKADAEFTKLLDADADNRWYRTGSARALAGTGVAYSEQGNYYMALDFYRKALDLYQKNNQKGLMSRAYNNMAVVYKSLQNREKAIEYLKKALKLQEETGEQAAAMTMTNIGLIYFEEGRLKEASAYYEKARLLFEKIQNTRGFALLENYLGDFYLKQKNREKAEEHYVKALGMYEQLGNKFGASLSLYNLGLLHQEKADWKTAMDFAQKSLRYAKEIGVADQIYHSEQLVSELYAELGNPSEALHHYKKYIFWRDSLTNQETTRKIAQAEMHFEYQKKEALLDEQNKRQTQFLWFSVLAVILVAALILLFYNRRQVKRRLTLQKEVAEYEQKALHLQMNPHFVFNCLGAISSFIVQNGTDSALKYLSKFSKLMRLTLEYSKGSLIPIDKEIESLRNYLELEQLRFNHKFSFGIVCSEAVEFNMGIPPLLIQPFVENAILHGVVPKEGDGHIEVNFDVENDQLVCRISDDGIGLTKSLEIKEKSVTAHKSMALEITRKRLEIMESTTARSAQIDISEPKTNNGGTRVTLRLPIQYIS